MLGHLVGIGSEAVILTYGRKMGAEPTLLKTFATLVHECLVHPLTDYGIALALSKKAHNHFSWIALAKTLPWSVAAGLATDYALDLITGTDTHCHNHDFDNFNWYIELPKGIVNGLASWAALEVYEVTPTPARDYISAGLAIIGIGLVASKIYNHYTHSDHDDHIDLSGHHHTHIDHI